MNVKWWKGWLKPHAVDIFVGRNDKAIWLNVGYIKYL